MPSTEVQTCQSNEKYNQLMNEKNSWIVEDYLGKTHFRFDGLISVFKASPILCYAVPIFEIGFIKDVGNNLYKIVANNRKLFSSYIPYLEFKPLNLKQTFISNLLISCLISYVFLWNMASLSPEFNLPQSFFYPGKSLWMSQKWAMYAFMETNTSYWFIMPSKQKNGKLVDVFSKDGNVSWNKPKLISAQYDGRHWRNFMLSYIYDKNFLTYSIPYAAYYLSTNWNKNHPEDENIEEVEVYLMSVNRLEDGSLTEPVKNLLYKYVVQKPLS